MYLNIPQPNRKIFRCKNFRNTVRFLNINQKFSLILKPLVTSAEAYLIAILMLYNFSADYLNTILNSCNSPPKQTLY